PRLAVFAAGALVVGAIALAGTAVQLSRSSLLDRQTESFTQFSIRRIDDAGRPVALLQVQSSELQPESYSVRVVRGTLVVNEWQHVSVAPGHGWQVEVPLPAAGDPSQPLQALLYRDDAPGVPYRTVSLDAATAARVSP
ncbi:MAG TPA: hypothetical protein VFA70_11115, partial [Dehalococcoidia bacterium]|nr:hypothetical protein [Dehalococcoidia bacterium]